MKLLNIGCGSRFHEDWVNVDIVSTGERVIAYNLQNGLPFPDASFDVVYHSHVLEHFSQQNAHRLMEECHRVLKPNGIIRVAVPDLENIAKEYLRQMEKSWDGNQDAQNNYEWIVLELFDQMVRDESGGQMISYLKREHIPNEAYIYQRLGDEARKIRKNYLEQCFSGVHQKIGSSSDVAPVFNDVNFSHDKPESATSLLIRIRNFFFKRERIRLLKQEEAIKQKQQNLIEYEQKLGSREIEIENFIRTAKFRVSGEIHKWMYDRYSLRRLLMSVGFENFKIFSAAESYVPNWTSYQLDTDAEGTVLKPDSLFAEAKK